MRHTREVLYDGPNLTVHAFDCGSPTLFITFNTYVHAGKRPSAFGASFLLKYGFSSICFVNKSANWSQSPDLAPAIEAVRASPLFRNAVERVAYGTSMGGFSALLLAGDLDCRRALVGAPQISIYPPLVPFDDRFATEAATIEFLRPDARDGMSDDCRYYIVYDPFHTWDTAHIQMLGQRPNVVAAPAPFTGHLVLATLLQMGVLKQMVLDFAADRLDLPAMMRQAHRNRWRSTDYLTTLARLSAERGRPRTAAGVAARAFALDTGSLTAYRILARFCSDARRFGLLAEASEQFLARVPGDRTARRNLATAWLQLSRFEDAAGVAAQLCDDEATAADWLLLSRCRIRLADMTGALSACDAGLARFGDNAKLEETRLAVMARLDRSTAKVL